MLFCITSSLVNMSSELKIHCLPYSIKFDGTASVNSMFLVSEDGKQSTFRGREMSGKNINCSGVILENTAEEGENEKWTTTSKLEEVTDWSAPGIASRPIEVQTYTWLASAIHEG